MKSVSFLTAIFFLLTTILLQAQEDQVAVLKDMIIRSYQDLGSLNTETGLSYQRNTFLTDDYKVHKRVFYNGEVLVNDIVDRSSYLKDLDDQDSQVLSDEALELGEIDFIQVTGDLGIASFQVDITYKEDDLVIYKAKETRIDRFRKEGGQWKYYSSNSDIIVTDINRSDCTYHLFSDGGSNVYLKVFYPSGQMFDSDFLEVQFKDLGRDDYEIRTNKGEPLLWQDGSLSSYENSKTTITPVKAKSRVEVAEALVLQYWKAQCANVKSVKLK